MGGQACVFYGGAEFSRDCDIAILCDPQNLLRLQAALDELGATTIAVPPFEPEYLLRGHAIHFRCHVPEAEGIRLDVMARMRGVSDFDDLWSRRTTVEDESGGTIELMSLPDLVRAKKTQRDKDWPMIRRLLEANYASHLNAPSDEQIQFWLLESRTPTMLVELASRYPEAVRLVRQQRSLLSEATLSDAPALQQALFDEQEAERKMDRKYWEPLKAELEKLRRDRR
jgi:hypothetical protein